MDNRDATIVCFRCKQTGHRKADCPHTRKPEPTLPRAAPPRGAPPEPPYKRTDTIDCPVCHNDWVAIFTKPAQILYSTYCPWCRIFETSPEDGRIYRRTPLVQV